jgi:mutator protein MutT
MAKKIVRVGVAIIWNQDRSKILIDKRLPKGEFGGFWEFPGGKIEKDETKEDAIIREIKEELGLEILVDSEFCTVEHDYPDFSLTMHSFICSILISNITLSEHIDLKWMKINELASLDWAEADLPIVDKLISNG